jgi:hypothetical protein
LRLTGSAAVAQEQIAEILPPPTAALSQDCSPKQSGGIVPAVFHLMNGSNVVVMPANVHMQR